MKNKKIKIYVIAILLLVLLTVVYFIPIISESKKLVKFSTAYWLVDKTNIVKFGNNIVNPCYFSQMKLKNNVELQCKELKFSCDDKIPSKNTDINKDTACAIITFDINGFDKKPNIISTNRKVQDQYQILVYNNGITTIPNSIEDETLNSRQHSFKRRIQSILLFFEIGNDIDTFRAAKITKNSLQKSD